MFLGKRVEKKSLKGHCCPWDIEQEVEQREVGSEDGFLGESPDLGLRPKKLGHSKVLEVGIRERIGVGLEEPCGASMGLHILPNSSSPAHVGCLEKLPQPGSALPNPTSCFPLLINIS